MQKDKIHSIVDAYKSMYDEDVLSENILSKLPGAHGRYMKKLKAAHDHHMNMHNGHSSLLDKIDPSRGHKGPGEHGNPDFDEERRNNHLNAMDSHLKAAESVEELAIHAKKNKLTSHPKGFSAAGNTKGTFSDAITLSKKAHEHSHIAINDDKAHQKTHDSHASKHGISSHMDHVKKLAKHVTYKSGTAHKNLN